MKLKQYLIEAVELPAMLPSEKQLQPGWPKGPFYLIARIDDYGLYMLRNFRTGGNSLCVWNPLTMDKPKTGFSYSGGKTIAAKWVQADIDRINNGGIRVDYPTKDGWPVKFRKWKRIFSLY